MIMTAAGAQADIVQRVAPEPSGTHGFQMDEVFYLWNTNAKKFFTEGNAWQTQASVGDAGLKVKFTGYTDELAGIMEWDGKTIVFNDSSEVKKGWKQVFFDSANAMFVDRGSQPNYLWEVVENGTTFRLHAADANPTLNWAAVDGDGNSIYFEKYVGLDATAIGSTVLLPFLAEDANHYIDWALVTVADYDVYAAQLKVYTTAELLRVAIEEAKGLGLNTNEWDAIYNDANATVEQLEAATEAVKQAIKDFNSQSATVDKPSDMTTSIANPNFDDASYAGWKGDAPNMTGSGSHGPANVAEHYNKNFDTYQELADMPAGVYAFEVTAFYRGQLDDYLNHTNYNAYIYAVNGTDTLTQAVANPWEAMNQEPKAGSTDFGTTAAEASGEIDGVTYYIPNDPSAGRLYFEAGYYKVRLLMAASAGTLRLGIKKDVLVTNDWTVFDNFRLTYYGNATEAYQMWAKELKDGAFDYSSLEGTLITESYIEAYNQALTLFDSADNYETVKAAKAAVAAAEDSLKTNINLWKEYQTLMVDAIDVATGGMFAGDAVDILADYCDFDYLDIVAAIELDNQQLTNEIVKVKAMIEEAKSGLQEDGDATKLLVNPNFTGNANGWTREAVSGGNVAWGSNCYEGWNNSNFDVYQVVNNAPVGIYEIEVQGFYRYLRGNNAYDAYQAQEQSFVQPEGAPVYVYMNDMKSPLKNVFDEPIEDEGFYTGTNYYGANSGAGPFFPDAMNSSAVAFNAGMYKSSAYGLVAKKGDAMRIGVKGNSSQGGDSWAIWDNFKLTFRGTNPNAVKAVMDFLLPQVKAEVEAENVYCNAAVKQALVDAIQVAETTPASVENKEAYYEALMNMVAARTAMQTSIEVYAKLNTALTDLENALTEYEATASQEALGDAGTLYSDVIENYMTGTYTDDQVPALIEQIKQAIAKLRMPQGADEASDENPVDFTSMIVNASYDNNDNTGWSGDAPAFQSYTNAEMFNKNFNYYQDIVNLPAGTYELSVDGFFRAGEGVADYQAWTANPDSLNFCFVYAETSEGQYSAPMKRLASGARPYLLDALTAGYLAVVTATEETEGYEVPNNMETAEYAFQEDLYTDNTITVKVGDDGKLRIGLKKDTNITNNWCIWDNWQLTFFGANSTKELSGDASGINGMAADMVVSSQYYNLKGVRTSGLTKGVNIVRQTMSDGSVRVIKVTIR